MIGIIVPIAFFLTFLGILAGMVYALVVILSD